jgi:phosphoglycolate phosphatase
LIRLIIYDLDGTLIDSQLDIANAVNQTLGELGLGPLPVEKISAFVGNGVLNLMRRALIEIQAPEAVSLERSIKLFRRRYGEHLLDQTQLYPSVRKVLEFFKDRKQAVLTNKPEDFSHTILRGLGVDSFFFKVMGGDQGFPKKPAPEAVLEILSAAGVSRDEAILVGDSATDVETGRNAGVKTVAVTYGFGRVEEIQKSQPDLILNHLEELIECPLLRD